MNLHSVPIVMALGITTYVGLYHLWLHLRRPNLADLYFAITCFVMTVFDTTTVMLYNAKTWEAAMPWQRIQAASLVALGMPFVLFISAYTKISLPQFLRTLLWAFPLGALLTLVERWGLAITAEPDIKQVSTRFGEIIYLEAKLGPLLLFFQATLPLLSAYVIWAALQGFRSSRTIHLTKRRVLPILIGAGIILSGLLHDGLVTHHVLNHIYITEYSWFGMMFLMSWTLSDEVVDASMTRQTLRQAEARITTTLDAIQDAVITTDTAGDVLHLNPAAEKMLAVPLTKARGRPLASFVEITSPETLTQVTDPIRYAVGRPPNPYGRLPRLVTTDGSDRRIDLGGAPLLDSEGRVQGAVVVLRDLTFQHNAIESLQHAKQMESMGQLAGGLAHDLNNLLTPILSYVELVQRQLEPQSRVSVFLGHVQEAAGRAANLTRQLLALSRKQVLDVQVISLNEFVRQTSTILQRLVPEQIEIVLDLDPQTGHVQIDPGQFEQVLLNLVTNARDAMHQGGRILISTQKLKYDKVELGVTDQGTGIDPDIVEHIFDPFFTTKPRGKGTGLGLASVRGIVEQHGGSIFVDSEVGAGTTFDIVLPAVSDDPSKSTSRKRPPADAARGHERVLVVEDDPAVRSLIHDALSQLGYSVYTADGLTTALAIASERQLDLLITDVVMPGADGPRVHQAVLRHHDIPCLYMTGHADDRLGDRGFLSKGTEVLRKPFTVGQLAEKIRTVLERPAKREGEPSEETQSPPPSV